MAHESERGRTLSVSELLFLDHVYRERDINTAMASQITQTFESDARSVLEGLVEAGLLERRGLRRNRTYHLSASIYRDRGEPAAYVRTHGFERLQMEQMILQYVKAHGQIARRNVMDLCRLSQNQAKYVLNNMTERGLLRLVGKGRGAHYVAADGVS